MFYLGWIVLTATGVLGSIAAFLWAIRTGQFADQGRARYLPLQGETIPSPGPHASRLSVEAYVMVGILGIGFLAMLSTVTLIVLRLWG